MIDLASNKKLIIIEYLFDKGLFTQYKVKKDLGLGMKIVNQTFNYLLEKNIIQKYENNYKLVNHLGLIEIVSVFRNMNQLKLVEVSTSLEKEEVVKILPNNVVFCLETALSKYSNYYKSNKISFYAGEKISSEIEKKLFYKPGNKTIVAVYKEKPLVFKTEKGFPSSWKFKGKKFNEFKFTSKIRTILDLYSDQKGNACKALIKQLWGK